jgi:hypothetical protein
MHVGSDYGSITCQNLHLQFMGSITSPTEHHKMLAYRLLISALPYKA